VEAGSDGDRPFAALRLLEKKKENGEIIQNIPMRDISKYHSTQRDQTLSSPGSPCQGHRRKKKKKVKGSGYAILQEMLPGQLIHAL